MDFNVHDGATGEWIGIIENPASAIWTRRYQEPGDFELYMPASAEILAMITDDCYITREDAPEIMIVEHIEITTDEDEGNYIIIAGRGAECMLDRRIIWEQTAVSGRVDKAMYNLITQNAIAPAIPARALPMTMHPPEISGMDVAWELGTIATADGNDGDSATRFRCVGFIPIGKGLHVTVADTQRIHLYYYDVDRNFLGATGWHAVTSYTITPGTYTGAVYARIIVSYRDNAEIGVIDNASSAAKVYPGISAQYTGDNLLEVVQEVCAAYGLGFQAVTDDYLIAAPRFEFLEGVDRCEGQSKNSPVAFTAEYENLLSSSYIMDTKKYKNVARVAGEGEGKARKAAVYGNASGMHRREIFVDARDLSTNEGEIGDADYAAMLAARGAENIAGNSVQETFEGEIDAGNTFILDEDYTLGDIITIENEYGIRKNVRIDSIMECWDEGGYTAIPTYKNVEV